MVPTAAVSSVTPKSGRKTAQAKRDKKRHKGLAEVPLQIIDKPAVPPNVDPNDLISIENMTLIGSYSWVDSAEPTILVPGESLQVSTIPTPYTLAPDKKSFVYEDAYRMPRFPNLARMRAIDIMTKEKGIHIDWPGIDFITDRNALRKLLKWASGSSGKEFRIDLELVGERTPGYGHRFELESTRAAPGCGALPAIIA
ncbi:hypothetical protein EVJ58_g4109 [Rhodofomes roseus]|uniref:Uncharacterized protein n=1 Tax=Rhodofomes roseus TaxID=34475 RepID=A0A4Y9YM54_9APHY|nr:hypothetical protein EVJ58_g4109 [Rhodofomes roseus]